MIACVILSVKSRQRNIGNLNEQEEESGDNDNLFSFASSLSSIHLLYDRLSDHLLFDDNIQSSSLSKNEKEDHNKDYYIWQFYALLSINLNVERKRKMILELREKIINIIEKKDPIKIANLNVFLNALGLDASQL